MTPCANEVSNEQNFESYEVSQTLAAEPVPGSDADLVKRMHARDAEALAATFDRYGRVVFSVILRVVRDSATAEDLVQETFLRVWNRVCGFDIRKGSMGPWVLAIAHNCAIDYLRSSVGRHRQVVAFDESDHPALHTDMEREILGSDRDRQIKAAVSKLAPHQRQAIELSYFGGLSQLEVAAKMGHPLGTVKTWVRMALKNLREDLRSPACVGA